MAEAPPVAADSISTEPEEYDEEKGKELAAWVWGVLEDDASDRRERTREADWEKDLKFIRGRQWDGPMPSYRRPIKMNAWRRALHAEIAVLLGGRPTMKIIPQGAPMSPDVAKTWQDALWAILRKEQFYEEKAIDGYIWALVGDGGFWKFGYGHWGIGSGEESDVLISSPHPAQVFPDKDCTDPTLAICHHITFQDRLDLATITARYGDRGKLVTPDSSASVMWRGEPPVWASNKKTVTTIGPAGGWSADSKYRRQMADVAEHWVDDPSIEEYEAEECTNLTEVVKAWLEKISPTSTDERMKLLGLGSNGTATPQVGQLIPRLRQKFGDVAVQPEFSMVPRWRWKYPKGRVITCSRDIVLRDIPNPYAKAFSWSMRWPFVYVPGAIDAHTVWRPGLLADNADIQYAINKGLSLLLENEIKVTNAIVIADIGAMDDDEWDMLQLFPGCKIRKEQGTDVSIVFPQPLPDSAFRFPDYMIRKLEEGIGMQDPQMPPGQVVASKTVQFLQQKGSFLLGIVAKGMDEANERAGQRIMGLARANYLPNRIIPYFEGEKILSAGRPLGELAGSVSFRVEATSAFMELQQSAAVQAQAAEAERAKRRN